MLDIYVNFQIVETRENNFKCVLDGAAAKNNERAHYQHFDKHQFLSFR